MPLGRIEGYHEHETRPRAGKSLVPSASKLKNSRKYTKNRDVEVEVSSTYLVNHDCGCIDKNKDYHVPFEGARYRWLKAMRLKE